MAKAIRDLALVHLERRPEEAARVLERCPAVETAALLEQASPAVSARLLALVSPRFAAECLAGLPVEAQTPVLRELSPPTAAALLRGRPRAAREALLAAFPANEAASIRDCLAYPRDSAGALASADAPTLFEDLPVERAVAILGLHRDAVPDRVVVLDRARRVLGVLRTPTLAWAPPDATVGSLAREELPVVRASTPVAKLVDDRRWDGALAPVVDRSGAFLGVLDPASLRRVRQHEPARPTTQLVIAFSELCWIGVSEMLAGRAPGAPAAETERRRG